MRKQHNTMIPIHRRSVRALIQAECCHYTDGKCLACSDRRMQPCIQRQADTLRCAWFRESVLPLDRMLHEALLTDRTRLIHCAVCNRLFEPGSNRAKYCPDCARGERLKQESQRLRKIRHSVRI